MSRVNSTSKLGKAFELFDHNSNLHVSVEELRRWLTTTGDSPLSENEFAALLAELDATADGRFNYKKLIKLMVDLIIRFLCD